MNNSHPLRSSSRNRALRALTCAFALTLGSVSAIAATDSVTLQPLADKALPLSATFEKVESSDGTPFVLKLKNDSKETLQVSGKVLLSVVHHAMDKARVIPAQAVEAGQVMTIKNLSADDRVVLSAPGHIDLEVKVPFKL
jgi:hypothetical protein